jgi:ribosomal protein L15E
MSSRKRKPVWDRSPPKPSQHSHLSPAKKKKAKAAAKRAGRPYPNLVDNMRAARAKP